MWNKIKAYSMPMSMLIGAVFHDHLSVLSFLLPYLIFSMLFVSYCNVSLKEIKFTKLHASLLVIQFGGALVAYLICYPIHPILAQGTMMCILAPTATSAIVITGMLGGDKITLLGYSLLSNISVAIVAPIIFSLIGSRYELDTNYFLLNSFVEILKKTSILLIVPLILAVVFNYIGGRLSDVLKKSQFLSFYLWNIALVIVTARTVCFILQQGNSHYWLEVLIVIFAFIVCLIQFMVGRKLGKYYENVIAGGQALGQKNTILAIWLAQTYLNPISSIGPGAYVLWQNIVNSYQVWKKLKH